MPLKALVALSIVGLFLVPIKAQSKESKSGLKVGPTCSAYQRNKKNCLMQLGGWSISISKDKINAFDGVHRSIIGLAVPGENTEWSSAVLVPMGKRVFLELEIWKDEATEVKVQSLQWLVYELLSFNTQNLNQINIALVHSSVIQKRQKSDKVVKDPMVAHRIELDKHQNVIVVDGALRKILKGRE